MRYREIHSTSNQYFLCVQYWWAHRVLKYESLGLPPVLALLLLLRVIRSFFALSESPFTNSLDSILPALLSTATGNWKRDPLHGLILSPEASCAILYWHRIFLLGFDLFEIDAYFFCRSSL